MSQKTEVSYIKNKKNCSTIAPFVCRCHSLWHFAYLMQWSSNLFKCSLSVLKTTGCIKSSAGLWEARTACRLDFSRQKRQREPVTGGMTSRRRSTAEQSRTEPKSSVYPLFTLPQHAAQQLKPNSLLLTAGWKLYCLQTGAGWHLSPHSPGSCTSLGCPNLPAPDKPPPRRARTHLWVLGCQHGSRGIKLFN